MMDVKKQRHGTGTEIITELCEYLREEKYKYVQLALGQGESSGRAFLVKKQISSDQRNEIKHK